MKSNLKVSIIAHTPNPEKVISTAAKLCYSEKNISEIMDDLTNDNIENFVNKLYDLGHESPFEHISFTFGIEGVSRIVEQQLTRHRLNSYSIKSGRYVKRDNPEFVYPKIILDNPKTLKVFEKHMEDSRDRYNEITELLTNELIEKGMKKSDATKAAIENARYLYPQGLATQIIVTMNLRNLWHFFNERCCTRAQVEIREMAYEILKQCRRVSPLLFKHAGAKCVNGYCPEGQYGCGIKPTIKELEEAIYEKLNKHI